MADLGEPLARAAVRRVRAGLNALASPPGRLTWVVFAVTLASL